MNPITTAESATMALTAYPSSDQHSVYMRPVYQASAHVSQVHAYGSDLAQNAHGVKDSAELNTHTAAD